MSIEEGVANLQVYGMCSSDIQPGVNPAEENRRKHEVGVSLIHMVGVPENEGACNMSRCITNAHNPHHPISPVHFVDSYQPHPSSSENAIAFSISF